MHRKQRIEPPKQSLHLYFPSSSPQVAQSPGDVVSPKPSLRSSSSNTVGAHSSQSSIFVCWRSEYHLRRGTDETHTIIFLPDPHSPALCGRFGPRLLDRLLADGVENIFPVTGGGLFLMLGFRGPLVEMLVVFSRPREASRNF